MKSEPILSERTLMLYCSMILLCSFVAEDSDDILGKWSNEDKSRCLEFVSKGNTYDAYVRCSPDKNTLGKRQVKDLVYKDGKYKGKLILIKKDKELDCEIVVKGNGRELEISVSQAWISKSQVWYKMR